LHGYRFSHALPLPSGKGDEQTIPREGVK
jgi:hypothetical protein